MVAELLRCCLLACLLVGLLAEDSPWIEGSGMVPVDGRPLVLLFTSPSCHWCQVLKADSRHDPALRQALAQTTAVAVDAERYPGLAARMRVRSFPTVLLINRQRQLIRTIPGYLPAADLAVAIRVLIQHGDERTGEAVVLSATGGAIAGLGEGTAEARIALRERLGADVRVREALWTALADERPAARVDAAAILAEQVGGPGGYDPLAPSASRAAQAAAWRAQVDAAAPEVP